MKLIKYDGILMMVHPSIFCLRWLHGVFYGFTIVGFLGFRPITPFHNI